MSKSLAEDNSDRQQSRNDFGNRQLFRRPQAFNNTASYEIEVDPPTEAVTVRDDAFVWFIPEELDDAEIVAVAAGTVTVGGSDLTVNIRLDTNCGDGTDIRDFAVRERDVEAVRRRELRLEPGVEGIAWLRGCHSSGRGRRRG